MQRTKICGRCDRSVFRRTAVRVADRLTSREVPLRQSEIRQPSVMSPRCAAGSGIWDSFHELVGGEWIGILPCGLAFQKQAVLNIRLIIYPQRRVAVFLFGQLGARGDVLSPAAGEDVRPCVRHYGTANTAIGVEPPPLVRARDAGAQRWRRWSAAGCSPSLRRSSSLISIKCRRDLTRA